MVFNQKLKIPTTRREFISLPAITCHLRVGYNMDINISLRD